MVTVKVQLSPPLGVFRLGERMQVISPEAVVSEYKNLVGDMICEITGKYNQT